MKYYNVRISEKADKDIKEIEHYFTNIIKEPKIGLELLDKLKNTITSLETMPFRHSLANDDLLKALKIRSIIVKRYRAFYTIADNNVFIVRVLHVKRALEGLF
jgi:addiction module RelE/StbE family toxin